MGIRPGPAYPCPGPARCNRAEKLARAINGEEMKPPRIRMRSGRRPRARFHASWSPASRLRTRRSLVRLLGVLGAVLAVLAIGANVYAVSFWDSLPSVHDIDATQFLGDTVIQDRNGQLLADVGIQGDQQ